VTKIVTKKDMHTISPQISIPAFSTPTFQPQTSELINRFSGKVVIGKSCEATLHYDFLIFYNPYTPDVEYSWQAVCVQRAKVT